MQPTARRAATLVSVLAVLLLVAGTVTVIWHAGLQTPVPVYGYWLENLVATPLYVLLAVLLLHRLPDHRLAWLFAGVTLAGGLQFALGSTAHLLAALGRPAAIVPLAVLASAAQMSFVLVLISLILYFPTGRLPDRRWRPLVWIFASGAVTSIATTLTVESTLPVGPDVPSPFAGSSPAILDLVSTGGVLIGVLAATASVAVRFRRAGGLERQQLRWFLVSVVAGILAIVAVPWGPLGWAVGPALVPTGMAIAILRYRLYDLDRIVSRTVTYAVLTLVLAGVYVGIVVGLQAVAGPEDASDLVVASATLVAAALFRPLRDRVQRAVDRRFNRSRYDAEQVVGRFTERLRDEMDLPTVTADLREAVTRTLHPGQVTLWFPPAG